MVNPIIPGGVADLPPQTINHKTLHQCSLWKVAMTLVSNFGYVLLGHHKDKVNSYDKGAFKNYVILFQHPLDPPTPPCDPK